MLVLLLSTVWCVGGYSQEKPEVTLDFTSSSNPWKFPEGYIKDGKAYTYTYNGYTITIQGGTSGAAMWTNVSKINYFLQLNSKGATLSLPAFDFAVSKIVLEMYSPAKGLKQNIYVDNVAVSTEVSGNKSYSFEINSNKQAANTIYQIKNSGAASRIKKIHIYKAASSKKPTTTTFDKQNVTLTTLDYASFTGQKAKLKAGETILTNELTYSKKDADGVITTLNNDGTLVLSGKAGTATVTAKFAGNDEYASSSESYTITIRKVYGNIAELKNVLTTTAKEYSLNLKDAVVTGIYDNKDKSGNFNIYIEDASAGILIFYPNANNDFKVGQKINGEVTIKGTTYNSLPEITSWTATESCTVIDGADVPLTTVTIAELSANFDKYESRRVKIENATVTTGTATANYSGKIAQGESELTLRTKAVAVTTTKDDVIDVIGYPATYRSYQQFSVWSQDDVIVKSSVVKTTLSFEPATTEYNVDNNNKDAFTAPTATVKDAEGNVVEGAAITYTSSEPGVATVGETDGKVTFVGFGTTVITANYAGDATHMASSNSYTINYAKVEIPTVTFNEEEKNDDALLNNENKSVNVTMKRTIGTGYLNPVCFPFAMNATQITEVFGEGSKVSSLSTGMADGNLHFDYVETMEAGKPYLVEPTRSSTTIEVKNVTIKVLSPEYDVAEDNGGNIYSFQGTFEPYAFTATDGTELFLGKDNTLYMPQSKGQKMKGFRAYFTTPKANESLKVVVNGQTTTISSLMSGKTMTGKVYNLNGQYVGTSLEGLAKGVYVMNGQKFVVK